VTEVVVRKRCRVIMATVPIQSLTPDTTPPSDAAIHGVVTLFWPYSSSTKQCALLLADPDFRLRNKKGQVRVQFTGASAEAVAKEHVGIGDEVVLHLQGAQWAESVSNARTPGKSVDGELRFARLLRLKLSRDGNDVEVAVDRHASPIAPPPHTTANSLQRTPSPVAGYAPRMSLRSAGDGGSIYSTPAFTQRLRLSGTSFLDTAYDPFATLDLEDVQPNKRQRLSFEGVKQWQYAERSPSPVKDLSTSDLELESAPDAQEVEDPQAPGAQDVSLRDAIDAETAVPFMPKAKSLAAPAMPPPTLPRLEMPGDARITTSTGPQSVPDDQDVEPATPQLIAVPNSALPLPSPFPREPAQTVPNDSSETYHGRSISTTPSMARQLTNEIDREHAVALNDKTAHTQPDSASVSAEELMPSKPPFKQQQLDDHIAQASSPSQRSVQGLPPATNTGRNLDPFAQPTTPVKVPLNDFGLDGPSSVKSHAQSTPQSERDRVMAQTFKSLFGFQKSPDLRPQRTPTQDVPSPSPFFLTLEAKRRDTSVAEREGEQTSNEDESIARKRAKNEGNFMLGNESVEAFMQSQRQLSQTPLPAASVLEPAIMDEHLSHSSEVSEPDLGPNNVGENLPPSTTEAIELVSSSDAEPDEDEVGASDKLQPPQDEYDQGLSESDNEISEEEHDGRNNSGGSLAKDFLEGDMSNSEVQIDVTDQSRFAEYDMKDSAHDVPLTSPLQQQPDPRVLDREYVMGNEVFPDRLDTEIANGDMQLANSAASPLEYTAPISVLPSHQDFVELDHAAASTYSSQLDPAIGAIAHHGDLISEYIPMQKGRDDESMEQYDDQPPLDNSLAIADSAPQVDAEQSTVEPDSQWIVKQSLQERQAQSQEGVIAPSSPMDNVVDAISVPRREPRESTEPLREFSPLHRLEAEDAQAPYVVESGQFPATAALRSPSQPVIIEIDSSSPAPQSQSGPALFDIDQVMLEPEVTSMPQEYTSHTAAEPMLFEDVHERNERQGIGPEMPIEVETSEPATNAQMSEQLPGHDVTADFATEAERSLVKSQPTSIDTDVLYPALPPSPSASQSQQNTFAPLQALAEAAFPSSMLPPTPQLTQLESIVDVASSPIVSQEEVVPIDGASSAGKHLVDDVVDPAAVNQRQDVVQVYQEQSIAQAIDSKSVSLEAMEKEAEVLGSDRVLTTLAANEKSARRSLRHRLSNVPDVISAWFSSRTAKELVTASKVTNDSNLQKTAKAHVPSENGHSLNGRHDVIRNSVDMSQPHSRNGILTATSYFTSLSNLGRKLNPSNQDLGASSSTDVLAVVAHGTKPPERAKGGPRDFFTICRITDASLDTDVSVRVEAFRPWKAKLPIADVGDVILLRSFTVKSRKRQPYLLSTDASAWCVWRFADAEMAKGNHGKPVWARKDVGGENGEVREEMKGPPVEFGNEERSLAKGLRQWWLESHREEGNE
jgi:hypothetical protein